MEYSSVQSGELIRACAQSGEAGAWEEFIRRFNPLIAKVVVRTAQRWGERSSATLDDLVQETYLKLCADNCRLLRTFESRQADAIYGYLKVVTANVVHDYFKGARATKRGAGKPSTDLENLEISSGAAPTLPVTGPSSVERNILLKEIDRQLVSSVRSDDRQRSRLIFWLYYRSGLTASAIASLPHVGLTTKGVESAILRLTRLVRIAIAEPVIDHIGTGEDSLPKQKDLGPA